MRLALVLALLLSLPAAAQPLGPHTKLPGFDAAQSRMVYEEGSRLLNDAQRQFRKGAALTGRALTCGLALFMQGAIEAAAFEQRGSLSPAQLAGARRAITFLETLQANNCDRPPGGGLGTGNEGDLLAKSFFDAYAPKARSRLEEVRGALGALLSPEGARAARDVMLAAALVAAGVLLAPLWAT